MPPWGIEDPVQVRAFAKAIGQRAKTDPIDAGVIGHFAEATGLALGPLPDEQTRSSGRRRQIVAMIAAERQREQMARSNSQAQCIAPGEKPNIDYRRTSLHHGTMIKTALVLRVPCKSHCALFIGEPSRPPLPLGEPCNAMHPRCAVSAQITIVQRTLHDELVPWLRRMIIEELRPGSRIGELRLCKRLGVSRTPLREALKVLSAEGLVRLLPNKGATVVRVTHKDVEEAVPLFGTLEALAGELACARIDKESLGRIKSTHRQMVEHFRRGERRAYSELNRAFHDAVFEAADNKPLSETYNMMKARLSSLLPGQPGRWSQQVRQMFQTAFQNNTRRAHWAAGIEDHEQMLAALEAGDGVQFAQIARRHIRRRAEVMHMAIDMLEARADTQHEWIIRDSQAATPESTNLLRHQPR